VSVDRTYYRETASRRLPAQFTKDHDVSGFVEEILHYRTHLHRTGEPFLWPSGLTAPLNTVATTDFPLSRTKYSALFAVYSTTFGVGDGSTTFGGPTITAPAGCVVLIQV
jgi:hypothetical protein